MTECSSGSKQIDEDKISYAKRGQKRHVFLLPESIAKPAQGGKSTLKGPTIVSLRHPRNDDGCLFLLHPSTSKVYELKKFSSAEPRCWFAETTLLQDGSMYIVTAVDPLFLVLPYLVKATEGRKFVPLDQILEDDTYYSICELTSFVSADQWKNLCIVKVVGERVFHKFSEELTLKWLHRKVKLLADKLEEVGVQVGQGSRTALVVSTRNKKATKDDYVRYACGMVVDYLSMELGFKLYEHLGVSLVGALGRSVSTPQKSESLSLEGGSGEDLPPPMKKTCSEPAGGPLEDYTKYNQVHKPSRTKTTTTKKSASQRALEKVDKRGMKSIGSFFTGGKT